MAPKRKQRLLTVGIGEQVHSSEVHPFEEAKQRLVTASELVRITCKSDAWFRSIRLLGDAIGVRCDLLREKPASRGKPVPGDQSYFLEATHGAVVCAMLDHNQPSFAVACKLIIDMLVALRDIELAAQKQGMPARPEYYYHSFVESVVDPRICYVFMLYLTYFRVEQGNDSPQMREIDELLDRHRVLSIISHHPAGISDCFVRFHGPHRFATDADHPFENRYFYERDIKPGDSMLSLIKLYANWQETQESRLQSLRKKNPALATMDPAEELLKHEPPITKVHMVPPLDQDQGYKNRVKEYDQKQKQKALEPKLITDPLSTEKVRELSLDPGNIDEQEFTFTWRGRTLHFGYTIEFRILAALVKAYPRYKSTNELMICAWGESIPNSTYRPAISRLRSQLKEAGFGDLTLDGSEHEHMRIQVKGDGHD